MMPRKSLTFTFWLETSAHHTPRTPFTDPISTPKPQARDDGISNRQATRTHARHAEQQLLSPPERFRAECVICCGACQYGASGGAR